MSRVLKYSAVALMLFAGVLMAGKDITAEAEVKEKDVQIKIITCEDGELTDLSELEALGEDATTIKVFKTIEGDQAICKIFVVGDADEEALKELGDIEVLGDGVVITKVIDGEDGFHGIIIHDGETQEFEDKESFEKYIEEHPELDMDMDINVDDCIKIKMKADQMEAEIDTDDAE